MRKLTRVLGMAMTLAVLFALWAPLSAAAAVLPPDPEGEALDPNSPPEVGATAYLVMDAATGQVLAEKNSHMARYPASITKILTLALTLEAIDLANAENEPVEVSQAAVDALIPRASMVSLQPGEVATVRDLIYATKIESANDASHALAEYVAGSMEAFAGLMNAKAAQLGLSDSNFTNPSGQPDDAHYVSAYDMAAITRWALSVPGFREVFASTEYAMGATNKAPGGRVFRNSNMIVEPSSSYYCEGVTGSKTGYTDLARYTLVTTATRGDTELICVVLDCGFNSEKYTSTTALLDYCFGNFTRMDYPVGDLPVHSVAVYGGGTEPLGDIDVFAEGEASFMLHHSLSAQDVAVRFDVPERYVMGDAFAPTAVLYLPEETQAQPAQELAVLELYWSGIEGVMAANTTAGTTLGRMAEEQPVLFRLALVLPLLALFLLVGRFAWVRWRRWQRRQKRLAAARAQMPIRIAERPEPPARPERSPAQAGARATALYPPRGVAPVHPSGSAHQRRASVVFSAQNPTAGRNNGPSNLRVAPRVEVSEHPRRVGRAR